jgi:transcriptional regulator with XRE-family HTH domain
VREILQRLGERIREIRIQRGFKSQEEFADFCRLHRTFIGHLETGRKDFRLSTIIRVAGILGITMQELFAGIEAGEPVGNSAHRFRHVDSDAILREISKLEDSVQKLKLYAAKRTTSAKSGRGRTRRAQS